jgi:hypothetical protein
MRQFRSSLAEHMDDGFAPRHLDSEIVALGRPGESVTAGQFTGDDAPPPSYLEGLVVAICQKWQDDGRQKAIIRVPPMRGGSAGLVARLMHALSQRGARLLDATGTRVEDKKRFLGALDGESRRTHAESQYDVMIGIQRVLEGTDWPACSAVYCVGMPGRRPRPPPHRSHRDSRTETWSPETEGLKMRIAGTVEHVRAGKRRCSDACPIALACQAAGPNAVVGEL